MTRTFNWKLVFKTMGVLTTLEALFMLVPTSLRGGITRRISVRGSFRLPSHGSVVGGCYWPDEKQSIV